MADKIKNRTGFSIPHCQELVMILLALVVFCVNLPIIGKCFNPFVFNDEMGYWTHGATIAGKDWTGISGGLAWYSFGYSFMLAPVLMISDDPVVSYRTALVLNVLMLTAVYFMYIYIVRYIFPELDRAKASVLSCCASLYTSYRVNAGIAFSELALLFVTTLVAFTLVRALKKPSYLNMGALGALCAYLFMVHNRTIGIIASAVLVVAVAVLLKKISLRHALVFICALGAGFVANSLIKNILVDIQWKGGNAGGNNAGSVFGKLKLAFSSVDNIKRLVSLLASQAFATFASTFGVALFGLWGMFRKIVTVFMSWIKAVRDKKKADEAIDGSGLAVLFIFCAFVATWIISAVFMFDFQRIDHVIYTRYFDIVMGMLIMSGLCWIVKADKADLIFVAVMPLVMTLCAGRASVLMNSVASRVFNKVCSPGLCALYEEFGENYYAYTAVALSVFSVIALTALLLRKNSFVSVLVPSAVCAVAFCMSVGEATEAILINQKAYEGDRALAERIDELSDGDIYVMRDTGTFSSFLQYYLPDRRIEVADNIEDTKENAYALIDRSDIINYSDYPVLDSSDRHILISTTAKDSDEPFNLPLSYMNTFDASLYIEEEDAILSNPASNYVCYGPYAELAEGDYIFTLDMSFDELNEGSVGFAEIRSNSVDTVYAHVDITEDMPSENGQLTLEMTADVGIPVTDIEIVLFLYEPANVSMKLNSIEVDTEE